MAILKNNNGFYAAFFAKYDNNGNYLWAHCPDHSRVPEWFSGWTYGYGLAVDRWGNSYFLGELYGVADFNPGPDTTYLGGGTQSPGYSSSYITKYDRAGNYLWAKAVVGEWPQSLGNRPSLRDLIVDDSGNLYVTGWSSGIVDFDPSPGIANLGHSATIGGMPMSVGVLVKYDSSCNYIWGQGIGDSLGAASFRRIERYNSSLYLTGPFVGVTDFDPGPSVARLTSVTGRFGVPDACIAKYDTSGKYLCANGMGGFGNEDAYAITIDKNGNVYVTGSFQDTVDFDPGPGVANMVCNMVTPFSESAFILKLACKDSITKLKVSLCNDAEKSYSLNGITYTSSGIYTQVLPNGSAACGCDSTIELHLIINEIIEPVITVDEFTLGLNTSYISYQWFKNGVVISGATGDKYFVMENADYSVVVTNDQGCTDTSAVYKVTNVAIHDAIHKANMISIYPNPATDILYIQRPAYVLLNIALSGIEGKTLISAGNAASISLKGLAAGIYFIRIADQEGNLIKIAKLVKQ